MADQNVRNAMTYSMHNRGLLVGGGVCGCYYCGSVYKGTDIKTWVDGQKKERKATDESIDVIEEAGKYLDELEKRGYKGGVSISEVMRWKSEGDTAICPKCGIDSVVWQGSTGKKTIKEFKEYLKEAHTYGFGPNA